jgi:hypothetical protein
MIRRNQPSGSASSRRSSPWWASNRKSSSTPILWPVLWNIVDTADVCNESDQPFDLLKEILLGQFGKSKWQSHFELLQLPMEMQGLQAQRPHGEAQAASSAQYQPRQRSFSHDVLIQLTPSMREVVGAGNHRTALAMVRATDTLWDG